MLRRLPAPAAAAADLAQDVTWLHGFLARLAGAGFPSSRLLPRIHGGSWTLAEGRLWEMVAFPPGHAVGWAAVPPMEQIGALLGRYHLAVRQILVTRQRPVAVPLAQVPPVLLSHPLDAILPERAAVIRQLAARLARGLEDTVTRPETVKPIAEVAKDLGITRARWRTGWRGTVGSERAAM